MAIKAQKEGEKEIRPNGPARQEITAGKPTSPRRG